MYQTANCPFTYNEFKLSNFLIKFLASKVLRKRIRFEGDSGSYGYLGADGNAKFRALGNAQVEF